MNASLFDADTFLQQTVTGANDTKYPLIPAAEYPAISKKLEARKQPGTKDPSKEFTVLDLTWVIDDATVKEETGLAEPTCRQSIFLDLDAAGQLDMSQGKNVQLGRLREALGLNDPTKPFSFNDLLGQPAIVRVDHTPNAKDPENPYANVTKVAAL